MKCPNCGHWNRASFPRCFRCGAPLPHENEAAEQTPAWEDKMKNTPKPNVYIQVDEEGNSSSSADERDSIAREMQSLHTRKTRGEEKQRALRAHGATRGVAPSSMTVKTYSRRESMFSTLQNTTMQTPVVKEDEEVEGEPLRPDAIPVVSDRKIDYDDYDYMDTNAYHPSGNYGNATTRNSRSAYTMTIRHMKHRHAFGFQRFAAILGILLLVCGIVFAGYQFIYKPMVLDKKLPPLQERCIIMASIMDSNTAHIIKIPAEEGAQIYIKELKKHYTVIGGYATVEALDSTWFEETDENVGETVTAVLTPYITTNTGEQKQMETISFEVEVPLAPITLVSPDLTYTETSSSRYTIQFYVEQGSTVTINGEDYSDLVGTQNGLISYNASIVANGNNNFVINVSCPYYRKNSVALTIYCAPRDIPIELQNDITTRTTSQKITCRGTTLAGATVTILSSYEDLDLSTLAASGTFSFTAVFQTMGNNDIIIQVDYPGKQTTVYKHTVYYVPTADIYTRNVWDLTKDYEYSDLLNNMSRRVANTQKYLCKGYIKEIISSKPQLAIFEMGTEESPRQILVENQSTDTWVVGTSYRLYADAFGVYNGLPRLIARFTYPLGN